MLTYCYERRLLIIRVHLQSAEGRKRQEVGRMFAPGTPWFQLPYRDKLRTIRRPDQLQVGYGDLVAALSPTVFPGPWLRLLHTST
jgi:hypothetical protein